MLTHSTSCLVLMQNVSADIKLLVQLTELINSYVPTDMHAGNSQYPSACKLWFCI